VVAVPEPNLEGRGFYDRAGLATNRIKYLRALDLRCCGADSRQKSGGERRRRRRIVLGKFAQRSFGVDVEDTRGKRATVPTFPRQAFCSAAISCRSTGKPGLRIAPHFCFPSEDVRSAFGPLDVCFCLTHVFVPEAHVFFFVFFIASAPSLATPRTSRHVSVVSVSYRRLDGEGKGSRLRRPLGSLLKPGFCLTVTFRKIGAQAPENVGGEGGRGMLVVSPFASSPRPPALVLAKMPLSSAVVSCKRKNAWNTRGAYPRPHRHSNVRHRPP